MRRVLFVGALVLAAMAGWMLPASGDHFAQSDAVFQMKCNYRATNWADAIVHPGQPGASHGHDYFGTVANAFSTAESLYADTGNCRHEGRVLEPDDHAAYWVPRVWSGGAPVDMSSVHMDAYYTLGRHHPPVEPFPYGLKIIAGNGSATTPQPGYIIRNRCVDNRGGRSANVVGIPDCRPGSALNPTGTLTTVVLNVLFPECWDGVNLDSPDHKSHMAYPTSSGCPASHPVRVPKLIMLIRYLGDWRGEPGSVFASGGQYSFHADFFNAWEPSELRTYVDTCLNAITNCGDPFVDI